MSNVWGIAGANDPTSTSNCTRYQKVLAARSRDWFGIPNKRSWISWSNNVHGMQCIRGESGRQSQWFNHYANEIEYKPPWRIFRELRSQSVRDICRRNTVMAKVTWPTRRWIHQNPSKILGCVTERQCQWVVHKECRTSQQTNQRLVARISNQRITKAIFKFADA